MKTTFDIVDIVYLFLKTKTITISGGIYKHLRPANSVLEDIVIGSLPVNNEQIQQAVVNINIHVPNVKLPQDTTQPDSKRLNTLTALIIGYVDEQYINNYWFYVQQQNVFADGLENYSNIRLNFFSENIKN